MSAIFRQYTFDDSFQQVFISPKFLKEYQIALTFATDYDDNDAATNGVFRPTWDQTKVTPEAIKRFKRNHPGVSIKVYITIGNRRNHRPFHPLDTSSWIQNATESLTAIIKNKDYNLQIDGIDVLYEGIDASPSDFTECVGNVIKNLKESGTITEASISPSFGLNRDFYFKLYSSLPLLIDYVDYQFQNEVAPVFAPNVLVGLFEKLVKGFYPRCKVFAGYSAENEDWGSLSPIVFFLGGMDILKKRKGAGISIHYHNYYQEASHDE